MNLVQKLIHFPVERPKTSISLGFLLFILFVPFVFLTELDFSAQAWLSDDDPYIERLNEFENLFGNDERLIVLVELKQERTIFEPDIIQTLSELTEQMWMVPEVVRVESLTNFHWSYAQGDELVTEPFIPEEEQENADFLKVREKDALEHRVIPGVFFSKDLKSAILYGRISYNPDKPSDFAKIYEGAKKLISPYENDERFKLHLLGEPVLSQTFQSTSFRDLGTMLPFLFLLIIIYLAYSFRSVIGVIIPLTIIVTSIGFTLGLIGMLGIKANSLTFVLPSILMAIAIADSVHLLTTFFDQHLKGVIIKDAALKSLEKNLYPIFLTSISTAIGFASLVSSDIVPVSDLGLLAASGTMSAMLFSYFLVIPILMMFMSRQKGTKTSINQRMLKRETVRSYISWVDSHKLKILLTFGLIAVVSTTIGLMNTIDSNPFSYFKSSDPLSKANVYTLEHYGGVGGPEILINSGEKEGIKNPEFLKKVDSFQTWLVEKPYINSVMSVVNILKEMNQALYQGDIQEYKINDQQDVIAQELFLYTLGLPQGMDINNQVDLEQKNLRLSMLWEVQNSAESLEKIKEIEDEALERGLDVLVTGKAILFQRMNNYVVNTFFTSISMALILITIILIFVFKSVKVGLLSLIPNFVPVVFGAALLTVLKIPIDIGCAIVASVTLGIAVDDTIHYLAHYNKLVSQGMDKFEALVDVMATTGLALIITSIILVSCFGIFIFANLMPNVHFGVLCSFVISMALVCDLLILPAMILFGRKETVQ